MHSPSYFTDAGQEQSFCCLSVTFSYSLSNHANHLELLSFVPVHKGLICQYVSIILQYTFFYYTLLIHVIFHSCFMQIDSSSKDLIYPEGSSTIEQMVWVNTSYRAGNPQGITSVYWFHWRGSVSCDLHFHNNSG